MPGGVESALAWPALALGMAVLALALWRRATLRRPLVAARGEVPLLLPLTGPAPGLEDLLAGLAAQTLLPTLLVVAVEDTDDPAHARISALAPSQPFAVRVVIAGRCDTRGQKNTNLIAALAAVPASAQAVLLLDADIRPPPWWLSALASPVLAGTHDLVTGYRWPVLAGRGLAGQLVAAIDRMMALLLPPARWGLAWGGSLALSRAALARLDLPRLLDRALADDLPIGLTAKRAGLRMLSRGALLVPTPGEGRGPDPLLAYRRQVQMVRLHRPGLWLAFPMLGLAALAGWLAAPWAMAALGLALGLVEASVARWLGVRDPARARAAQLLLHATPLPALALAWAGLASWRARRIGWRHVTYAVRGPNDVRVLHRARPQPPAPAVAPCPITGAASPLVQDMSPKLLEACWRIGARVAPSPLTRHGPRIGLYLSPCGLHFFQPAIAGDEAFYGALYRRLHIRRRIQHKRTDFLVAAARVRPGDRVLDVGCLHGDFAALIPGADYTGLEPNAAGHGSGPQIVPETAQQHALRRLGHYDLACAFQVLEHAPDPVAMAEAMVQCLKPGGLLVLAMPLWPSALTRLPNNLMNLPPHHLSWWNADACRALADRLGLEVLDCGPVPPAESQVPIHWMDVLCPVRTQPGRYLAPKLSWHLAFLLSWPLARLAGAVLGQPRSARPIDVALVARKPATLVAPAPTAR